MFTHILTSIAKVNMLQINGIFFLSNTHPETSLNSNYDRNNLQMYMYIG